VTRDRGDDREPGGADNENPKRATLDLTDEAAWDWREESTREMHMTDERLLAEHGGLHGVLGAAVAR
jgi:hypothetical protein